MVIFHRGSQHMRGFTQRGFPTAQLACEEGTAYDFPGLRPFTVTCAWFSEKEYLEFFPDATHAPRPNQFMALPTGVEPVFSD